MLLALDGSTRKTGYSFGGVEGGSPRGGVWALPGAEEHVFDLTLSKVYDSILGLAKLIKAQHVCIEAPILINDDQHASHTTIVLMQLTGAMRTAATRAGAQVHLVGVSTTRKHFVGRGNLSSKEGKAAVQARCDLLGWAYADDNQADSAAVWSWGMSRYYPQWSPHSTPLFGRATA